MIGSQPPFRVGQRVRPSAYGIERLIFQPSKATRLGTVTKVDKYNCPTVLWDGRRTATSYYPDFVEAVRRSKAKWMI